MSPASTTATQRGAGAVTVFVLLLLVGAVTSPACTGLEWMAAGAVQHDAAPAAAVAADYEPDPRHAPEGAGMQIRAAAPGFVRTLSVTDATLPAPRAPDRDSV